MGVDLIAIAVEAEREFNVTLPRVGDFWSQVPTPEGLPNESYLSDCTAQQLFDWICETVQSQQGTVPNDAWTRYQKCVCDVLFVEPNEVTPDAWLGRDLGLS